MLLQSVASEQMTLEGALDDLRKLHRTLEEAGRETDLSLNDTQLIEQSVALIQQVAACQTVTDVSRLLETYLQKSKQINSAYCEKAVAMQLSSIDEIIKTWCSQYLIKLDKSRTLIVGPDGPREGLIEKQYFDKLYADAGMESKTDYITMLSKQMLQVTLVELLEELGKREINRVIGKKMLNDPHAMFKDVLAADAPRVLSALFKKPAQCPLKIILSPPLPHFS